MTDNPKRICIISVAFPPMRTSGAIQIDDLAREILRQGHAPTVICPDHNLSKSFKCENRDGVEVLRLRTGRLHEIALARRAINETLMPYFMWLNFKLSPLSRVRFDGIVIYAPSIFFAAFARRIKRTTGAKIYLIQRDIFPHWALDLGLLKPGLIFEYFARVARAQYRLADVIGIQSPGNHSFFQEFDQVKDRRVEVLNNWLAPLKRDKCQINFEETLLKGRRICVYAGNIGRAQGIDTVVSVAEALKDHPDIGFAFVGRGSEFLRIKKILDTKNINNLLLFEEIPPEQIYGLLKQCHVGLVALDRRHSSHNLPGKVLSYLQVGIPIFGVVNPENDLIDFVNGSGVGFATSVDNVDMLANSLASLIDNMEEDPDVHSRCISLFQQTFSPDVVVPQLLRGLDID